MSSVPTYVFLFILAIIAAVTGRVLAGRVRDDPGSFPGWILYAVAAGCVILGLVALWMEHNY
jgi:hypothetical protein